MLYAIKRLHAGLQWFLLRNQNCHLFLFLCERFDSHVYNIIIRYVYVRFYGRIILLHVVRLRVEKRS